MQGGCGERSGSVTAACLKVVTTALTSARRCLQGLRGAAKGCSQRCLQVLHLSLEVYQGGHSLILRHCRVGRLPVASEGFAQQGARTIEDRGGRVEALADGEQPGKEGGEGG